MSESHVGLQPFLLALVPARSLKINYEVLKCKVNWGIYNTLGNQRIKVFELKSWNSIKLGLLYSYVVLKQEILQEALWTFSLLTPKQRSFICINACGN